MKYGILTVAALAILAQPLSAQRQLFDIGHLDIDWTYADGEWSVNYSDEMNFPPTNVPVSDGVMVAKSGLFLEGEGSLWPRPSGSAWDFVGVDAGELVWLFPAFAGEDPILEPGFATRGVPSGTPNEVRIDLVGVDFIGEGVGYVSLFTAPSLFSPAGQVHMSNFGGIDGQDFYLMGRGDHRHVDWVFTHRGVYLISLAASVQDGADYVTSDPQTLMVAVGLSPMELWLLEMGVDPGELGDADSPAGDGVANLLKYALGLPPLVPVGGPLVAPAFVEDGGGQYLALDLALNPQAQGIAVRVETSADLADWQSGEGHTVTLEHTAERIHARDALAAGDAARRFIRLAVERDGGE